MPALSSAGGSAAEPSIWGETALRKICRTQSVSTMARSSLRQMRAMDCVRLKRRSETP